MGEAYEILFNEIHIPMFVASTKDCTVTYYNRAMSSFLGLPESGYSREKKISPFDNFDESDRKRLIHCLQERETMKNYGIHGLKEDGEEFWVLLNTHTHEDKGYIEGSFIDVTHIKRLEERLLQAQKMEVLGRMARGIAHDFNNILAVINGYTEMLLGEDQIPEQVEDGLREIRKAYTKATTMTGQLLSFGPKQIPQPKTIHLHQIIQNTEKMLLRLLRRDVMLRIDLAADLDLITVAPGQIEQVLINLVLSTQDAIPEAGHIIIQTLNFVAAAESGCTLNELKPGSYLVLRVRDSGDRMVSSFTISLDLQRQLVPVQINTNTEAHYA